MALNRYSMHATVHKALRTINAQLSTTMPVYAGAKSSLFLINYGWFQTEFLDPRVAMQTSDLQKFAYKHSEMPPQCTAQLKGLRSN